jgi:hypothetical protein
MLAEPLLLSWSEHICTWGKQLLPIQTVIDKFCSVVNAEAFVWFPPTAICPLIAGNENASASHLLSRADLWTVLYGIGIRKLIPPTPLLPIQPGRTALMNGLFIATVCSWCSKDTRH